MSGMAGSADPTYGDDETCGFADGPFFWFGERGAASCLPIRLARLGARRSIGLSIGPVIAAAVALILFRDGARSINRIMSESSHNTERRGRSSDQREQTDRRGVVERRSGMDRRRGPGRRRGEVRKAAEEGEIAGELLEFVMAIDEYKRVNDRPFPSWSEVFEIIHYLGYRKVAEQAKHINTACGAEAIASPGGRSNQDDETPITGS